MSSRKVRRRGSLAHRLLICLLAALLMAALPLTMAACNNDEEPEPDPDVNGEVSIGWIAWDECIATTFLWKRILEDEGYDVNLTQLDVAPVYAGLAAGDLDFFTDAWLPVTHEDYWEEYGDRIEDLGIWYEDCTLEITVPAYVEDVDTIADLKGKGDMFGGVIVGIEPGAGLMRLTREAIMPGYELEDEYELLEGSTPAMLAELKRAIDREEPIVVTLWWPHWVYGAYDLKDLEDTDGLFGEADNIHLLARLGFSDDFPEIAEWLSNFSMDDDTLADLARLVVDEYGSGLEDEAVDEWLSVPANRALVDSWLGR